MVLPLLALGAMAAGGGLQLKGAIDAGKASGRASTNFLQQQTALLRQQMADNEAAQAKIAEQQVKQQGFRDEAGGISDAAIVNNSLPAQDALQKELTDKRNLGYQTISNLHPVNIDIGSSPNAPSVVGNAIAKSISDATARGVQQAKAKAAIEGFGDLSTNNQLTLKDNSDSIRTIAGLNNISSRLAQQQKDYMNVLASITSGQIENAGTGVNARLAYDKAQAGNYSTIGDILFKAGSMGAGAAKSGASAPAATTTNAPLSYGPYAPARG